MTDELLTIESLRWLVQNGPVAVMPFEQVAHHTTATLVLWSRIAHRKLGHGRPRRAGQQRREQLINSMKQRTTAQSAPE